MLKIYNSLSKQKEEFVPIEPGRVRMYVCGMTVYDYCHLGHARVLVVFDVIARYLRARGYQVTYVRNITDIDDKIIDRAQQNGEAIQALTERYIGAMHEDCAALGVLPPDIEPRATQSMDEIIGMIARLEEKGFTYQLANGDVYYDVAKFAAYGKLSGRHLDEQIAGSRVELAEGKKSPADFVLWKSAKPEEPSWPSPWGPGRPGWHIECSAMSTSCLGNHFDIHGGGMDLKFPHHENEIAQTEAATGEKSVNYWIHNGFVNVKKDGAAGEEFEKMSKSLGNFFTVRELLKLYQPEEIRFFILNSHYRSPLNYSLDNLEKGKAALTTLYTALRDMNIDQAAALKDTHYAEQFNQAMDDDFNTADALAVLFQLAKQVNRCRTTEPSQAAAYALELKRLGAILGLLQADPVDYLQRGSAAAPGFKDEEIEELIVQRNHARDRRDFAEADRIRDLLAEKGIVLEDGAGGTTWRRE